MTDMSPLMDRLRRKQRPAAGQRSRPSVRAEEPQLLRGGMGEPYCSQECYDEGGAAITRQMLEGVTNVRCHVCQEPLNFAVGTPTSMVYIGRHPVYFHQIPACDGKVRAEVAQLDECVLCGKPTILRQRWEHFAEVFGAHQAARLVAEVGLEPALVLGETALSSARQRWSHRYDPDFLTPEQKAERNRRAVEAGTSTVETRAAFFTTWEAELVAGDAARAVITEAGLPDDDRDLYLDLAASVYRALN